VLRDVVVDQAFLRLAVVMWASVMSDAVEMVLTGGELTLFEAVDPVGLTSFCCVARHRSGCPA
jgi:hypothetical protein